MGKVMKIYERIYDNPIDKNGNEKPNNFLGEFKIIEEIFEDFYSGKWIGIKDNKVFLISQHEVSGMQNPERGGSRFVVEELKSLTFKEEKGNE